MVFERAFTSWWLGYSVVKAGLLNDLFGVGVNGEPIVEEKIIIKPPIKVIKPKVVTSTVIGRTFTPTVTTTLTDTSEKQDLRPQKGETVVSTYGVGKVLSPGVIDYGFNPEARTVITVPKEQVVVVQTAIDSGVMGDVFTGTLHKAITVQAEEEKFTPEVASTVSKTATTFLQLANTMLGNNFAFPSIKRSEEVVTPGSGYRDMFGTWRYR